MNEHLSVISGVLPIKKEHLSTTRRFENDPLERLAYCLSFLPLGLQHLEDRVRKSDFGQMLI